MAENIDQLIQKLELLLLRQEAFAKEIHELREEIYRLKSATQQPDELKQNIVIPPIPSKSSGFENDIVPPILSANQEKIKSPSPQYSNSIPGAPPTAKSDIEKIIGENLINKIGIAILIIGVAIGTKYSIEHDLISPVTRMISGYLVGIGLLAVGLKLKKNYVNFSAVLVSGAIAIMYFITYAAYSFYGFYPRMVAFALMIVFTVLTVLAATYYNRQVIANIGLVGAYAVPLLLSEGQGNVATLFSYMTIINIGILFISVKKYWKSVYYASFILTWFIFLLWYVVKFDIDLHFRLALLFSLVFFIIFYLIFLAYKLVKDERFTTEDIILLLSNSFIFYGIGYSVLSRLPAGESMLGLFTLGNAVIHLFISVLIYRQKPADKNLFYLTAGLVLIFVTIAIPVQLDGNWVTLLWAGEAALLFWIGRTRNVKAYKTLSYPLMILAFISLIHDWVSMTTYSYQYKYVELTPFLNIHFLSSLLFIAAFSFITFINNREKEISSSRGSTGLFSIVIPAILLTAIYFSFRVEISNYWNALYSTTSMEIKTDGIDYPETIWNEDIVNYKKIWLLNWTALFFAILSFINIRKLRSKRMAALNIGFNVITIIVFLTIGLYILSELRESYLNNTLSDYYQSSAFNIGIRYISFGFLGLLLYSFFLYSIQDFVQPVVRNLKALFETLLLTSILLIASSELITWMDILNSAQSDKLALSILWGLYSLLLIALGIWKNKKHLRIGAILLFGITLVKLFVYDISHLDTISKTILFVTLGLLLLIISFLYNKYKHLIISTDTSEIK